MDGQEQFFFDGIQWILSLVNDPYSSTAAHLRSHKLKYAIHISCRTSASTLL